MEVKLTASVICIKMNLKMRIIKFIFLSLLATAFLSGCAKHDFFDENLITGDIGPQAYWDVESAVLKAGTEMGFKVQYYSTVSEVDYSEVWYNIIEIQERTVTCPWVTTFTYSVNSIQSEEKLISQKIQEYPHSLAIWSDTLRAYTFENKFPVSGTLAPFGWVEPQVFDSAKMTTYFGEGFMQQFKDSLQELMEYADYKNMLLGMSILDDFKQYTDSTQDINVGDSVWVYHFPKDEKDNMPVPNEVTELYNSITFDQLVEGAEGYNVIYKRTYLMNAILRVYDVRGIYGTTVSKAIDIN